MFPGFSVLFYSSVISLCGRSFTVQMLDWLRPPAPAQGGLTLDKRCSVRAQRSVRLWNEMNLRKDTTTPGTLVG